MTSDFLSYSLCPSEAPRLKVFQEMPVEIEKRKMSSDCSQYGDLLFQCSDSETNTSLCHSDLRRDSIGSRASFSEPFLEDNSEVEECFSEDEFCLQLVN